MKTSDFSVPLTTDQIETALEDMHAHDDIVHKHSIGSIAHIHPFTKNPYTDEWECVENVIYRCENV